MKDEIKEIVSMSADEDIEIKYINEKGSYVYRNIDIYELLDYITNLQEENEKFKQWDCNKDTRNSRQRIANAKQMKQLKNYKSRNEKAIEYIKNNCEYKNKGFIDEKMIIGDWFELKELLNILTGGDK